MQFDPRQRNTLHRPVQPAGFFTGVQLRPVIVGVIVDYIATYAGMYFYFAYLAGFFSKKGEASGNAIPAYVASTEGLLIVLAIGMLGTAIGGFVAGIKAGDFESKHGAFVAVGSLTIAFFEQLASEEVLPVPEWYRVVSILGVIPAGALGGYAAALFKTSGGAKRSGGSAAAA
jgi:hypothetical protein